MNVNILVEKLNKNQLNDPYIPEEYCTTWIKKIEDKIKLDENYKHLKYTLIGAGIGSLIGALTGASCALITNKILFDQTMAINNELIKNTNNKINNNNNNLISHLQNDIENSKHMNGGQLKHDVKDLTGYGGGSHLHDRLINGYIAETRQNMSSFESKQHIMLKIDQNTNLNSYNTSSAISLTFPVVGCATGMATGGLSGYGISKYTANRKLSKDNVLKLSDLEKKYEQNLNILDYKPSKNDIYDRIIYEIDVTDIYNANNVTCIVQGYFDPSNFIINTNKRIEITLVDNNKNILFMN